MEETVDERHPSPSSIQHLEQGDTLEAIESLELSRGLTCDAGTRFQVQSVVGNRVRLVGADAPLVGVKKGGKAVQASYIPVWISLSDIEEYMRRIFV